MVETIKSIEASLEHKETCYIRLTGGSNNPIVYKNDYNFEIGKSIKLLDGKDVTLFASGASVSLSLKIAMELKKKKNQLLCY